MIGENFELSICENSNFISDIFDDSPVVIAGPCSVESEEQIFKSAKFVKEQGGKILRGGAFKPRTNPRSFKGLGMEGLKLLKEASIENDIPVISEIMDISQIDIMLKYVDILQIGTRNMYNYNLLSEIGKLKVPVMLKRGISATVREWIMAAEHIACQGNSDIVFCERGIRTFETYTRNTLDLSVVPIIKKETGFKVIVDPSHGTGLKELIEPMSKAAIACGADGIMVEMHPKPEDALCDGHQSLNFNEFSDLMKSING